MKYERLEIEVVKFNPDEVVWKPDELCASEFTCPVGQCPSMDSLTDTADGKKE